MKPLRRAVFRFAGALAAGLILTPLRALAAWNKDVAGGSCYNCHQLAPQESSYGTLGPSLRGFGKLRGNTPEIQKYAYGRIYNAKAYKLCSQMPRLGHSGTLSEQQIKDLVAYLVDPESPVNK